MALPLARGPPPGEGEVEGGGGEEGGVRWEKWTLARVTVCIVCVCVGGGYSRRTGHYQAWQCVLCVCVFFFFFFFFWGGECLIEESWTLTRVTVYTVCVCVCGGDIIENTS